MLALTARWVRTAHRADLSRRSRSRARQSTRYQAAASSRATLRADRRLHARNIRPGTVRRSGDCRRQRLCAGITPASGTSSRNRIAFCAFASCRYGDAFAFRRPGTHTRAVVESVAGASRTSQRRRAGRCIDGGNGAVAAARGGTAGIALGRWRAASNTRVRLGRMFAWAFR